MTSWGRSRSGDRGRALARATRVVGDPRRHPGGRAGVPVRLPDGALSTASGRRARRRADPDDPRGDRRAPERGVVLDVGVGGGATSLPLAGRASTIVGVDEQSDMLRVFETAARSAGVGTHPILGRWPDVETQTPAADVVVCGHVVYNVADLASFARALERHANLRVVLEL